MIKEKRNQGFLLPVIIGIIMLVLGLSIGIYNYYNSNNSENLPTLSEGYDADLEHQSKITINVYGIYPEPLADVEGNNTVIWLVAYENGYIGLEAAENDKNVLRLVEKGEALYNKPEKIVVKYYKTYKETGIENYTSAMTELLEEATEIKPYFLYNSYVSLSEVKKDQTWAYVFMAILSGLGIIVIVMSFRTKKHIGKAYDDLYQAYPELNGSVESLLSQADFVDDVLKVVIYKHHLITYYRGFAILDLNKTIQLYHHILVTKQYFITVNRQSTLIGFVEGSKKQERLPIKNIGKATDDQLQTAFYYISRQFPNILLGK